jgi:hypothetical protein
VLAAPLERQKTPRRHSRSIRAMLPSGDGASRMGGVAESNPYDLGDRSQAGGESDSRLNLTPSRFRVTLACAHGQPRTFTTGLSFARSHRLNSQPIAIRTFDTCNVFAVSCIRIAVYFPSAADVNCAARSSPVARSGRALQTRQNEAR